MKTKLLTLLFLLGSAGLLQAQQKLTLDLDGARKQAMEHNKTILNSNLARDKAELALRETIANGLPQLNAAVDYSNALGAKMSIRFAENMPASEIEIKPQSNFNLNATQLIFSGNYIVGIQTARLYRDMAGMSIEKTELEVMAQVTESYQLVLHSDELLKLLRQNLSNLQNLYTKTEALERVGIIEKNDLDQLFVQVNTLQNAVKSSERQMEMATNLLRLQLGVSAETEIELTSPIDQMLDNALAASANGSSFRIENHIDFRLMNQQEIVSRKMIDMQRANALPTLSGYYRYTYKLLKPDFDMTPANMLGLQMNIPLFSSGVRNAQVKQSRIDLETTQNNKSLLSDQLRIQEKQLLYNYNSNLETYINQKTNVEVSRRVYSSLKLKYEQGLISGLDLINADNNYLRSETDYITAIMQLLQSRVQLQKLYGQLN
jgi:outer membrane protein TolC